MDVVVLTIIGCNIYIACPGKHDVTGSAGRYQACYTVVNAQKGELTLVENCITVNVDPLSPPLLNTPADEDKLLTAYPQFTWLPPTPIGLFNDLGYAMVLVEVFPGQGK